MYKFIFGIWCFGTVMFYGVGGIAWHTSAFMRNIIGVQVPVETRIADSTQRYTRVHINGNTNTAEI